MIKGINTWQATAERVNYAMAKLAGVEFNLPRASEGIYADPKLEFSTKAAREVGMLTGAYHAIRPEVGGERQAETFMYQWDLVKPDFPPIVDVEADIAEVGKEAYARKILRFRNFVAERTGHEQLLWYASERSWRITVGNFADDWACLEHHWVADPNNSVPILASPFDTWKVWQTGQERPVWMAKVGALQRHSVIDVNLFAGNMNDLRVFAGLEPMASLVIEVEVPKELEEFTIHVTRS